MRNRFGKYIQDNHTPNNERQPDNSRDIQRLTQNEPADHRDKYNARADQIAYATPTGIVRKVRDRKKNAAV